MWQNLPVQLNLRVTFHFDRYAAMRSCWSTSHLASGTHGSASKAGWSSDCEEHRYLSLLATLSKWMMRVLLERMRQHPRPDVPRRFHTIRFTQGWQTSAVIGTMREGFWHALRFRRNVAMVIMDIRQCFDHMDVRRVIAAPQPRHLPRWLVRGVARELCLLRARQSTHRRHGLKTQVESTTSQRTSPAPFLNTC